jgi:nucleotide-binding universal stress UspA family protein
LQNPAEEPASPEDRNHKEAAMLKIQAILAPVDFSACSRSAFRVARALAQDYRARLIVLHVAMPPPFVTPGELARVLQAPNGYRGELEYQLRQLYPSDSAAGVEYRVQDGRPAVEIVAVAREVPCDLIVMGTEGRTGLGRWLSGSVAEKVVRKAHCPVLIAKARSVGTHPATTTARERAAIGEGNEGPVEVIQAGAGTRPNRGFRGV